ncbi:nitric oxide synthase interacting protein, variant [Capsaspora owczarzaki ATCC 30864]|nr:nitric oxide synthase interacting protein, variant [Capsaspora owczarzaki ATCC 30864]
MYSSLLSQKQDIAMKERRFEQQCAEEAAKEIKQRAAAMQALVDDLYRNQSMIVPQKRAVYSAADAQAAGIQPVTFANGPSRPAASDPAPSSNTTSSPASSASGAVSNVGAAAALAAEGNGPNFVSFTASNGLEFVLDANAVEAKRKQQQEQALVQLQNNAVSVHAKPGDAKYLPSFWIPALTPDAQPVKLERPSTDTLCLAGAHHHPIKLKQLIPVNFSPATAKVQLQDDPNSTAASAGSVTRGVKRTAAEAKDSWMCSGCIKTLTNSQRLCVLRPCGHVFCRTCVDMFIAPASAASSTSSASSSSASVSGPSSVPGACVVCNAKVRKQDVIDVRSEGTGFAGHGEGLVAVRHDVAFQGF